MGTKIYEVRMQRKGTSGCKTEDGFGVRVKAESMSEAITKTYKHGDEWHKKEFDSVPDTKDFEPIRVKLIVEADIE